MKAFGLMYVYLSLLTCCRLVNFEREPVCEIHLVHRVVPGAQEAVAAIVVEIHCHNVTRLGMVETRDPRRRSRLLYL